MYVHADRGKRLIVSDTEFHQVSILQGLDHTDQCSLVSKHGKEELGLEGKFWPAKCSVDSNGHVYVADFINSEVFNLDTKDRVGLSGMGVGQNPIAISSTNVDEFIMVTKDGKVYLLTKK